jgi:enoyl-CoA hydratase
VNIETLKYTLEENIATVYLNRPPHNPLNHQMFQELSLLMDELEQDKRVRSIIITGKGDRAFTAGVDIKDMMNLSGAEILQFCQTSRGAYDKIESISKPVIAAVNGLALGGGCELALACDFRICSTNTRFGQPEINLGIIPGGGGTQRLQRLIGQPRAKELLYFGEMIDAEKAQEIGLVNEVMSIDELLPKAVDWANKLANKPVVAMQMLKKAVNAGADVDLKTALDLEGAAFGNAFASEDCKEGMNSCTEKRKPQFVGK